MELQHFIRLFLGGTEEGLYGDAPLLSPSANILFDTGLLIDRLRPKIEGQDLVTPPSPLRKSESIIKERDYPSSL